MADHLADATFKSWVDSVQRENKNHHNLSNLSAMWTHKYNKSLILFHIFLATVQDPPEYCFYSVKA